MSIRFESNFQRIAGVAPYTVADINPLERWFRVHEWQVDEGFTGNLLMVMLNVEPQFSPPATVNYGWMRVLAVTDTSAVKWNTVFERKMIGAVLSAKQFTPRLVIIPVGSGLLFTAGQGLMTKALCASTTSYRWWSCYVIDAEAA
jgi:hypothetical protein